MAPGKTNRIPRDDTGRIATSLSLGAISMAEERSGRPTAVAICLGDNGPLPLVHAMDSAEEVNDVIRGLDEMRAAVWPASKGIVRS